MLHRALARLATNGRRFESCLLPLLAVLLAMALYLHRLEATSLWFDELGTLTCAGWEGSWADAIRCPLTVPATPKPPLPFLLTHFFLALGNRVFVLRLPAAVFAALTVSLVYTCGRAFFNRRVGFFAALLLAIAPFYVRYGQEARMYTMFTFFSALSLYFFWRAIRATRWTWWLAFAVANVLNLYTHLFALLPLGVMVLFALGLLIRHRAGFPFRARQFVAALVLIPLLFAPMIPYVVRGLAGEEGLGGTAAPDWDFGYLVGALRLLSGGNDWGVVVYLLLFLLAAATLARRRRELLILALAWIGLPIVLVLVMPLGQSARVRYFIFALPVYLLLVACGLQTVLRWPGRLRLSARARPAATILATVVLLGILAAISGSSLAAYYRETKQNWRDATRLVTTRARPGDRVYVRHVYHREGVLFYARQWPEHQGLLTRQNVRLLPGDPAEAFRLADECEYWLIVPERNSFLPGGSLDDQIQPYHQLTAPLVLSASNVPQDAWLIGPTSFRPLAVVQVTIPRKPAIHFWADEYSVPAGGCTWLRWDVENVSEVYLADEGVMGRDGRQVCPTAASRYELRVIHLDGTVTRRAIDIAINP